MVERRGECLTISTAMSNEKTRHPKLSCKRENFVQRFSVVEYLQKLDEEIHSALTTSC